MAASIKLAFAILFIVASVPAMWLGFDVAMFIAPHMPKSPMALIALFIPSFICLFGGFALMASADKDL